uniref:Uncharacterized protein n=1 Tax=Plectus sambesii TaxID=2011161 RepID=A0A914XGW5_9BILA
MNRYLNITQGISTPNNVRLFMASTKGTILLTCAAWLYVTAVAMVLVVYDAVGEDFFGFYAARRFQNFWLSLVYMTSGLYAALAFLLSFYFYNRMHKFVENRMIGELEMSIRTCTVARSTSLHSIITQQERRDTLAIMTIVKWTTLIPLVSNG